jgi:hypothetical protein
MNAAFLPAISVSLRETTCLVGVWRNRHASFAVALATTLCMGSVSFASGHGAVAPAEVEAQEELDIPSDVKTRGIDLGEFRIQSHYPVEAQKSTVRFVLYASVATEHYAEIKRLVDAHEHKLRDQVIIATRMTPLAAFDEPGLESFRRRIFLRLRRALPELVIDDVYVSAFELTVKSL